MLVDARSVPRDTTLAGDVCIIGAGVAGITIARELAARGVHVLLLESGGAEPDRKSNALLKGASTAQPTYLERSRARAFGGTSHRWSTRTGFRTRPLPPDGFEARSYVPGSGWPFGYEHLEPYYRRAHEVCRLGPFEYDVARWSRPEAPALALDGVEHLIFHFGPRDCYTAYLQELQVAPQVDLVLHANVLDIATDGQPETVSGLQVGTLDGNRFSAKADRYVLATGAIENARVLLASNRTHRAGLGNAHDLVGRYFGDHATLNTGRFRPTDPSLLDRLDLYRERHMVDGHPVQAILTLDAERFRSEQILSTGFWLLPSDEVSASPGVRSLRYLASAAIRRPLIEAAGRHAFNVVRDSPNVARYALHTARRRHPARSVVLLRVLCEQAPNRDSRVTLDTKRDALGMPRARLAWRIGDFERHSIRRAQEIIGAALEAQGIGRLEGLLGDEDPPAPLLGDCHHMGTTRMHTDPRQGVVDTDLRVHGMHNLYVAGTSVYPSGGFVNPILTNVALALRLADHLAAERG